MQQMIFIAELIACSTCFEHHYVHHQELESIIQVILLLSVGLPVANAPDLFQPCGLLYYP
jgi:hypothetical protein